MFAFDDLEEADPTPVEATFSIDGELFTMPLSRSGMTPREITDIWEKDWGVLYASRLRFEAPPDAPIKWLNHHSHAVPSAPAVVRLDGMGSILQAVALALRQHGGAAATAAQDVEASLVCGPSAKSSAAAPSQQKQRGSTSRSAAFGSRIGRTSTPGNSVSAPKATVGPAERSHFKNALNAMQRRSGKFGQGRGEPSRLGQTALTEEERLRQEREEYLFLQKERRREEERRATEELEHERREHTIRAGGSAASAAARLPPRFSGGGSGSRAKPR